MDSNFDRCRLFSATWIHYPLRADSLRTLVLLLLYTQLNVGYVVAVVVVALSFDTKMTLLTLVPGVFCNGNIVRSVYCKYVHRRRNERGS